MVALASPLGGYPEVRGSFVRSIDKAERLHKSAGIDMSGLASRPAMPSRFAMVTGLDEVAALINEGEPTRAVNAPNPLNGVIRRLQGGAREAGVRAMLIAGADATSGGALKEAARVGDAGVIGLLMERGATFGKSEFTSLIEGAKDRMRLAREAGAGSRGREIVDKMREGLSEAFKRMGGEDKVKDLLRDPDIQRELDGSPILRETIHKAQQVFDTRDWTQKTKVGINLSGPSMG